MTPKAVAVVRPSTVWVAPAAAAFARDREVASNMTLVHGIFQLARQFMVNAGQATALRDRIPSPRPVYRPHRRDRHHAWRPLWWHGRASADRRARAAS